MSRGFEKISLKQWKEDVEWVVQHVNIVNRQEKEYELTTVEGMYEEVTIPKRGTKHSAGYDIVCPFDVKLLPKESIKIPTGLKAYMQDDEYVMIVPRSSMGFKYFMRLANTLAVGDSDYYNNPENEGHYWIKIRNESTDPLVIKKGQAFAQAIFQKYLLADNDTSDNIRSGGIGSTDGK